MRAGLPVLRVWDLLIERARHAGFSKPCGWSGRTSEAEHRLLKRSPSHRRISQNCTSPPYGRANSRAIFRGVATIHRLLEGDDRAPAEDCQGLA